ncbi:MAG: Na+/H+ antiporter subunit B [Chloroflexi bacterium]|nr:Na+/H+ antiporter subunit B [Chloroflexota bacterium]
MKIDSLILRTMVRYLFPLLLLFAVFVFLRGHNEPGGGFIAGLVASAAYALYSIAYNSVEARRALGMDTRYLIGAGLLVALLSGLPAVFSGQPFLTGLWGYLSVPGVFKIEIGSPVLFDLGVFLAVVGVTLTIIFALEEAE